MTTTITLLAMKKSDDSYGFDDTGHGASYATVRDPPRTCLADLRFTRRPRS
jgi:hypothetical protein